MENNAERNRKRTAELEMAFAKNPGSSKFIQLAEIYLETARHIEAMVVLKKGLRYSPDNINARLLLARVYERQAKYKKAIKELNEILKSEKNNLKVEMALSDIYFTMGENTNAKLHITNIAKNGPVDDEIKERMERLGLSVEEYVTQTEDEATKIAEPDDWEQNDASKSDSGANQSTIISSTPIRSVPGAKIALPIPKDTTITSMNKSQNLESSGFLDESVKEEVTVIRKAVKQDRSKELKITIILAIILSICFGIYLYFLKEKSDHVIAIEKNIVNARRNMKVNIYSSYQQALKDIKTVLNLDTDHTESLCRKAYIHALFADIYGVGSTQIDLSKETIIQADIIEGQKYAYHYATHAYLKKLNGKSEEGILHINEAIKKGARSPVLLLTLADLKISVGKFKSALEDIRNANRMDTSNPLIFTMEGNYYMKMANPSEAIRFYDLVLNLEPTHGFARILKWMAVLKNKPSLEDIDLSIKEIKDAITELGHLLSPKQTAKAHAALAYALWIKGSKEDSIESIKKANLFFADDHDVIIIHSIIMAGTGRLNDSLELLNLLNKNAVFNDVTITRFSVLRDIGNLTEAYKTAVTLKNINPDRVDFNFLPIRILIDSGKIEEVDKELKELNIKYKDNIELLFLEIEFLHLKKEYDQALTKLKDLLDILEKDYSDDELVSNAIILAGRIWQSKNDNKTAFEYFVEAVKIDNSLGVPHYYLANILKIALENKEKFAKKFSQQDYLKEYELYLKIEPTGKFARSVRRLLSKKNR